MSVARMVVIRRFAFAARSEDQIPVPERSFLHANGGLHRCLLGQQTWELPRLRTTADQIAREASHSLKRAMPSGARNSAIEDADLAQLD
jgi:hypothetical protein